MIFILFTSHIKTVIANEAKRSAAIFQIASSAKPPRNDIWKWESAAACLAP
jgi:hypothetical protein